MFYAVKFWSTSRKHVNILLLQFFFFIVLTKVLNKISTFKLYE